MDRVSPELNCGKSILIIDDDIDILDVVAMHVRSLLDELGRAGVEILTASSGEQAMRIIGRRAVDLVITDYQMPEFNGLELIRAVRSSIDLHNVATVLMSADHDIFYQVSTMPSHGIDRTLEKPVNRSALKQVLTDLLQ
jgi:YesN/AraC family two-component response regulator